MIIQSNNRYGIKADKEGLVLFAEVQRVTDLSASTIRRRIAKGDFPPPIPGRTRLKWDLRDIETYLDWRVPEPRKLWNPYR